MARSLNNSKPGTPATFQKRIEESIAVSRKLPSLRGIERLDNAKIKDLIDGIIQYAYVSGASDIHVDPGDEFIVVRYRIDGILHDVILLPKRIQSMIVTRIKVLSGLRTDEHQSSQDGRFRIMFEENPIDIRVSIIPTFHEENIVMRLLAGRARALNLSELGLSPRDLDTVERNIKKSYGMILATGPTGSGKTTTLYSVLKILNERERSIITIEDPIEYAITGMTQIQVNSKTNLTFAHGLRAIVRQDPNIIMVGEIRDEETAGIATNAAMTGHLLLSTLHTNDAAVTLPRLLDMGIEPFLIASTINIAIGQRLIRRICPNCRVEKQLTPLERKSLNEIIPSSRVNSIKHVFEPRGCDQCDGNGFTGRVGIYEVLEVSETIRRLIMQEQNADIIREAAVKEGMTTMFEDGILKVEQGDTSLNEVLRVIHE